MKSMAVLAAVALVGLMMVFMPAGPVYAGQTPVSISNAASMADTVVTTDVMLPAHPVFYRGHRGYYGGYRGFYGGYSPGYYGYYGGYYPGYYGYYPGYYSSYPSYCWWYGGVQYCS